jgi:hypothetical protein
MLKQCENRAEKVGRCYGGVFRQKKYPGCEVWFRADESGCG